MTTTVRSIIIALATLFAAAAAQANTPKYNLQFQVDGVYDYTLSKVYKSGLLFEAGALYPVNDMGETEFALRFGVRADDGAVKGGGMIGASIFPNGDTNLLLILNVIPTLGHDLFLGLLWEIHFPVYVADEVSRSYTDAMYHVVGADLLWEATRAVTFGFRAEARIGRGQEFFPVGLAAEFKTNGGAFEVFPAYQYARENGNDLHGFLLRFGYLWKSEDAPINDPIDEPLD